MNKRDMIDMALRNLWKAKAADGADGAWRCNRGRLLIVVMVSIGIGMNKGLCQSTGKLGQPAGD